MRTQLQCYSSMTMPYGILPQGCRWADGGPNGTDQSSNYMDDLDHRPSQEPAGKLTCIFRAWCARRAMTSSPRVQTVLCHFWMLSWRLVKVTTWSLHNTYVLPLDSEHRILALVPWCRWQCIRVKVSDDKNYQSLIKTSLCRDSRESVFSTGQKSLI